MKRKPWSKYLFQVGLTAIFCVACLFVAVAEEWARLGPFTEVNCQDNSATVKFQGRDYQLISVNDLPVGQILDYCRQTYQEKAVKRFSDDLVEVLEGMKHPMAADNTVKLELQDVESGKHTVVEHAPMTHENQHAVVMSRPPSSNDSARNARARQNFSGALNNFEQLLRQEWSYYEPSQADFLGAISQLRAKLDRGMDEDSFGLELQKILSLGLDGHAEVEDFRFPGDCLPFLMEPSGGRFVAFKEDRSGFLDDSHPYVSKLDGKDLAQWMEVASHLAPRGSKQYVRRQSLRNLRHVQFFRRQMGLPETDPVRVELLSADGASTKELQLPLGRKMPVYGVWPKSDSRLLDGNIGYLRLPEMDEGAVASIREWMPKFRETRGLIVDVRDNGGGSREALRLLYSFLVRADDPPKVVNAAVYRLSSRFPNDPMSDRFMYVESDPIWSSTERDAIAAFKAGFHPQWQPPASDFSPWHYLVLNRLGDPSVFNYNKPVIVLMNEKCFSATDIFLAGLKGLPGVKLMGTASGGGSSRPETTRLQGCGLSVRLGTMISFKADGTFFDGAGTTPDMVVEPDPAYFVGGSDNALQKAITFIGQTAQNSP